MSDQTELGRNRPRMWQTYAPFVEFYVGAVDILRSASGKPRTLISFTHDMYAGTGGFWTLEVFDPAYIAMEELLVATGVKDTEVADQAYEDTEGGIPMVNVPISPRPLSGMVMWGTVLIRWNGLYL